MAPLTAMATGTGTATRGELVVARIPGAGHHQQWSAQPTLASTRASASCRDRSSSLIPPQTP